MYYGGITDGDILVTMFGDSADLWERASVGGTPVREICHFAHMLIASGARATRHVKDTVIREVIHDGIEVVVIECLEESGEHRVPHFLVPIHDLP